MDIYAKIDGVILKELCFRIKQARTNAKLTQTSLAEISGLQRVHISRIESGKNFNIISFIKLLRALNKLEDIGNLLDTNTDSELIKLFK